MSSDFERANWRTHIEGLRKNLCKQQLFWFVLDACREKLCCQSAVVGDSDCYKCCLLSNMSIFLIFAKLLKLCIRITSSLCLNYHHITRQFM